MANKYCTEGISFPLVEPQNFINRMIAANVAKNREEAIALAVFNGKPVLARRNWDRACYEGGKVSEATKLKLSLVLKALV